MRTQEEEEDVWNRKADGAAIDREKKILYLPEFKRTTGQRADFEKKTQIKPKGNMKMWWER